MNGLLVINFKDYSGKKSLELAKTAESFNKRSDIVVAVAPHREMLEETTKYASFVLAQYVTEMDYMSPRNLKEIGVWGSLVNHSNHRTHKNRIANLINKLKRYRMKSVVCCENATEAENYAQLNPTYVAVEPPELIGTGKSVSTIRPELIRQAVLAIESAGNSTETMCGAGITYYDDVRDSLNLGVNGVLVSKSVIEAKNQESKINELYNAFVENRRFEFR